MRTLLVLLVGIAIGVFGLYVYQQQKPSAATSRDTAANASDSARDAANRAVARTREVASDVADAMSGKMKEWNLTPENIRAELSKSGEVVRENTAKFREKVGDARIVATIKGKFVLEKDIPANAVTVESIDGKVVLSGTLPSETQVAKVVALALDTDGVHGVKSTIQVSGK